MAAASGRADVVRQLAAAGSNLGKALPMDYRTLLRQQRGSQPAAADGADGGADAADAVAVAAAALSAASLHEDAAGEAGDWDDQAAVGGGEARAPPPKRGRYVTAGPPRIPPPSLQYCTALHLAALHGQQEAVAALLATGQCDVNAKSIEGTTPLHMAAWAGHTQVGEGSTVAGSLTLGCTPASTCMCRC